jgi:hypothetical protein
LDNSAIGRQLLRFAALAILLALAFAPIRALYSQRLSFDTTIILTSSLNPSAEGDLITFTALVRAQTGAPLTGSSTFVDT